MSHESVARHLQRLLTMPRCASQWRRPAICQPGATRPSHSYQREVETVFRKEWIFLGRADHIPNPGDYFTLEHTGVPLIILRDRNGELRGFAEHLSASRLPSCLKGRGTVHPISPYPGHRPPFALDGRLVAAPGMQGIKNFDIKEYGLVQVCLETWGGFLFINFDDPSARIDSHI